MDELRKQRATRRRLDQVETIERPITFRSGVPVVWSGSQWLSVVEYPVLIGYSDVLTFAVGAGNNQRRGFPRSDYTLHWTRGQIQPTTGATNNGTNYFTYSFVDSNAVTIWSFTTAADGASTLLNKTTTTFTQPAGATTFVRLDLAATGAPSNHSVRPAALWYRLVVP